MTVVKMQVQSEVVAWIFVSLLRMTQSFEPVEEGERCRTVDGRNGTCVVGCPPEKFVKDIENICGFEKNSPITCCPDDKVEPKFVTIDRICRNQHYFDISTDIEGFPFSPIFEAVLGEHPHMAVLGWSKGNGEYEWDCGGSLIHPLYVLTAAHCLKNKRKMPDVVRLGSVDLTNASGVQSGTIFDVQMGFKHPAYTDGGTYNDIAILQIDTIGFLDKIPDVACLWTQKTIPHQKLLAMGFGAPEFGKVNSLRLYQGNLSLIETDDCKQHYNSSDDLPNGIIESQICALDPELGLDTCQGDSGGPLQFDDWYFNQTSKTYEKRAFLVGITSLGTICRNGVPGIYTRIYPYLSWIEEIISRSIVETGKEYKILVYYFGY